MEQFLRYPCRSPIVSGHFSNSSIDQWQTLGSARNVRPGLRCEHRERTDSHANILRRNREMWGRSPARIEDLVMASYKQPCQNCGNLIDRYAKYCIYCHSRHPFGFQCPTCLHPVGREQVLCSSCGRPLNIVCPHCGQETFVDDQCDRCGQSLLVQCANRRCNQWQFFQNTKCTACGKAISVKQKKRREK